MKNLFDYKQPETGSEDLTELFSDKNITINHIVSNQPESGGWYEQEEDEWLVLLEGEAILEMDAELISLKKGDTLYIPAFQFHRVQKSSSNALWLTVHFNPV